MIVADSTPLIALARIGAFSLFQELYGSLVLPDAVYDDVVTRGRGRAGTSEVQAGMTAGWIERKSPTATLAPPLSGMHAGEIQAIALARELQADLLIDEGAGRRRAVQEGVHVVTTLDVLLLAKGVGRFPTLRTQLDALRAANFYLDDDTYDEALRRAGELPPASPPAGRPLSPGLPSAEA